MRFTLLAWFFFAACLGLSAGGPPDLAALLRSAEAGDAEAQFTLASTLYQGGSADQADFASRCSARHLVAPRTASGTVGYRCCATPR